VFATIEFAADGVSIYSNWDDVDAAAADLDYGAVDFLRITGSGAKTQTRSAGVIGGGFGVQGAAEGILAAQLINAVTRKSTTTIETFVHFKAGRCEVILLVETVTPQVLGVRLGPAYERIEAAHKSVETSKPELSVSTPALADQLSKLSDLHSSGLLTEAEFSAAKARLLGI
jgi:hypothetical protein